MAGVWRQHGPSGGRQNDQPSPIWSSLWEDAEDILPGSERRGEVPLSIRHQRPSGAYVPQDY